MHIVEMSGVLEVKENVHIPVDIGRICFAFDPACELKGSDIKALKQGPGSRSADRMKRAFVVYFTFILSSGF